MLKYLKIHETHQTIDNRSSYNVIQHEYKGEHHT